MYSFKAKIFLQFRDKQPSYQFLGVFPDFSFTLKIFMFSRRLKASNLIFLRFMVPISASKNSMSSLCSLIVVVVSAIFFFLGVQSPSRQTPVNPSNF